MALFGSKATSESVTLIDIDSSSVGAGLAVLEKGKLPALLYTTRNPIEPRAHEETADALFRTLDLASEELLVKGAPVLRKYTGSGQVDRIIASIGAPWQKSMVRIQSYAKQKPFTFTHALLAELVQKAIEVPEGFEKYEETVVATMLNGYDIPHPFGKKALRADLLILSSLLSTEVAERVQKVLRKTYHTHALTLTAFSSIVFTLFRDLFVHEKDFLVMHISGESTDVAFIKQGLLVDSVSNESGVNDLMRLVSQHTPKQEAGAIIDSARNTRYQASVRDAEKEWLDTVQTTLRSLAERHPLPRTLFLLTDTETREYLTRLIDSPDIRTLWLSDDPLRIIPLQPSHIASFVQAKGEAENDISLSLLALYTQRRNLHHE